MCPSVLGRERGRSFFVQSSLLGEALIVSGNGNRVLPFCAARQANRAGPTWAEGVASAISNGLPNFSASELKAATGDFSEANILGNLSRMMVCSILLRARQQFVLPGSKTSSWEEASSFMTSHGRAPPAFQTIRQVSHGRCFDSQVKATTLSPTMGNFVANPLQ